MEQVTSDADVEMDLKNKTRQCRASFAPASNARSQTVRKCAIWCQEDCGPACCISVTLMQDDLSRDDLVRDDDARGV